MQTAALLALTAVLCPAAGPAEGGRKQELARLQGTWEFVSLERNRKTVTVRPFFLQVRGERLFYTRKVLADFPPGSGQRFTLHPGTAPRAIDIEEKVIRATGQTVTRVVQGIYEVKGDTLKLLLARTGRRPASFDDWSHADLWVYRRQPGVKAGQVATPDKK